MKKVNRLRTRRGGNFQYAYEAHVTGGAPIQKGFETAAVGFFPVERLPSPMPSWNRPIIADALARFPDTVERTIKIPTWQIVLIRIGLKIRDWRTEHILKR